MADAEKHITYSLADIQRYLQGGMSPREMHDLERAALEDPFLADALEGYSNADMQQTQMHLAQIKTAIRQREPQGKVAVLAPRKKYLNWQIAAAVALFICITGVTYFIFYKKANDTALANNTESTVVTQKADTLSALSQQQAPASSADTMNVAPESNTPTEKSNAFIAKNKREISLKKQQSASHKPAPAAASPEVAITGNNNQLSFRAPGYELAGTITDTHQQPVPNATVMLHDSTKVITDRNGAFSITTSDSAASANITAFGYKPLINLQLKKGQNNITLKEKPFLLSDVEVMNIGSSGKKSADTTATMPEGGWQSFREYVYQKLNKKYDSTVAPNVYIDDDLQLEFSISEAGEPVDFKILHTPDEQTATQAISTIKAGPKWKKTGKKNKMRMTIRYK